jgi:conjugal transfer/entry exclusion protein
MPTIPDVTPPDYSTVVGQIRLLVPDVEQLANLAAPSAAVAYIFSDAQIQAFATLYSNNVKRAAAQAKLVLATSEALINKVIRTADYTTDGAKLGAELRAQAKQLQDEADKDDLADAYDESFITVGYATKWDNSWL